jgi:hypothetical protein
MADAIFYWQARPGITCTVGTLVIWQVANHELGSTTVGYLNDRFHEMATVTKNCSLELCILSEVHSSP